MTARANPTVQSCVHAALDGRGRIVLAVSGGIDSMVLLDAAASAMPRDRLVVATFDHGTGEWAATARSFVEARSADLGVACVSGRATTALASEAQLRAARWSFLRDAAARTGSVCATAHTSDDQVETVLMRVLRDAGARGLAALNADSDVLRPLLTISRETVTSYAQERRLQWVDDPSNQSLLYLLNRARHDLLPALRAVRPSIDDELLAASTAAAHWRTEVERFVAEVVRPRVAGDSRALDVSLSSVGRYSTSELSVLWPAIVARVGLAMDRRGVARLSEFTRSGRVGARIQLSGGWEVVRSRGDLELRRIAPPEATVADLLLSNSTRVGEWCFRRVEGEVDDSLWVAWLPADGTLVARRWLPGDAISVRRRGAGDGTRRKVKRLLTEAGVTGHKRPGWPVVLAGDKIVWIPGIGRSAAASNRLGRAGLPFVCEYVNC